MRVLVLSFYYHPDLSAGSFRTTALIKALTEKLPEGAHVDVVSTLPNRYSTFSCEAPEIETHPGLAIRRIRLPNHKSGMADQSRAFIHFAKGVMRHVQSRQYDLVYATSSRLMTATLGAWIARQQKAKLYLDIRDIFVDTINDVLPRWLSLPTTPLLSLVERWTINQADKVNLVSRGFRPYFEAHYPYLQCSFFTNGVDEEFIEAGTCVKGANSAHMPLTVLYAGNMGEGQGLHNIVPALAKSMRGRVVFRLIGDGGRKAVLQTALQEADVDNVEILPPVKRDQLIQAYQEADVLFLHLSDYDAFKNVLPSKLFEYAAMGKPVWAGVSGYAADFVKSEISNAVVFAPCDAVEAQKVFSQLLLVDMPRTEFMEKYSRTRLMRTMADDLLSLM
ncbi:MAG: glycosyltransferase family 4 protein [Sulfuricaulis sp.]|uniref:glycosyltransferase family 4 protein n=1 Tax=Sulfuricaulis sp. TaxID=2003553 RepID=UPI0025F8D05F|nr:glycosyltransferase family 4 protein [Sulfuricaulis sp.]MCR4348000.1 glycosyltransferase family 4 protein [Sulfuricaulis sp.]